MAEYLYSPHAGWSGYIGAHRSATSDTAPLPCGKHRHPRGLPCLDLRAVATRGGAQFRLTYRLTSASMSRCATFSMPMTSAR